MSNAVAAVCRKGSLPENSHKTTLIFYKESKRGADVSTDGVPTVRASSLGGGSNETHEVISSPRLLSPEDGHTLLWEGMDAIRRRQGPRSQEEVGTEQQALLDQSQGNEA